MGPYPADLEASQSFIDGKRVHAPNNFLKPKKRKKVIFTACHSGKLKLTFTSPNIISTSSKNVLMSRWISRFFCNLNSSKNFTCPWGKLITEFTSPIAKSTSPGLSDVTFFARCNPSTQDSQNTTVGTRDFTGAFSSGLRSVSLRPTLQTSRYPRVELPLPSPPLIPTKVTFIPNVWLAFGHKRISVRRFPPPEKLQVHGEKRRPEIRFCPQANVWFALSFFFSCSLDVTYVCEFPIATQITFP